MLSRFYGDCLCDCHCHRSKCKESRLLILNNFLLKFLALTVSWIDIRNDKEKGLFQIKFIERPILIKDWSDIWKAWKAFILALLLVIFNFQAKIIPMRIFFQRSSLVLCLNYHAFEQSAFCSIRHPNYIAMIFL